MTEKTSIGITFDTPFSREVTVFGLQPRGQASSGKNLFLAAMFFMQKIICIGYAYLNISLRSNVNTSVKSIHLVFNYRKS